METLKPRGAVSVPFGIAAAGLLLFFHQALEGKALGAHVSGTPPFQEIDPGRENAGASDLEVVMLPWQCHVAREYSAGRVPLWNPFAGTGQPFLASEQPAPFHPFTLAALLLPWRWSLLVLAVLRFCLALGGAWALARDLDLSEMGSAIAAAAFATSGSVLSWICYPIGGLFAHVPLLFLAARRHARALTPARTGVLIAILSATVLAGHLEHLALIWTATGAIWLLARPPGGRRIWPLAAAMAAAAGISAAMIVPCAEYLANSTAWASRRSAASGPSGLLAMIAAVVDMDLMRGEAIRALHQPTVVVRSLYFGALALYLAVCGSLSRGSRLLGVTTLAFLLVIGRAPVLRLIWRLPLLDHTGPERLVAIGALGLALLAGRGIDAARARRLPGIAHIAGAATVITLLAAGPDLSRGDLASIAFAAIGAAVTVTGLVATRAAPWILLVAILAERAAPLQDVNPWSTPDKLYPETAITMALARAAGHERIAGWTGILLPNASTVYAIRDVRLYDAIGVRSYDQALAREGSATFLGTRPVLPTPMSRVSGARLLILTDRFRGAGAAISGPERQTVEIESGTVALQRFPWGGGFLASLGVEIAAVGRAASSPGIFVLQDGSGGTLWSTRVRGRFLPRHGWIDLPVDPEVWVAPGTLLALTVKTDATAGGGFALRAVPRSRGQRLVVDDRPTSMALALRTTTWSPPEVAIEARAGGLEIATDAGARPRARLERDLAASVRYAADGSTRVVLDVDARSADRLVLADVFYPGWRATIDGVDAPIDREGPFRSVAIPAGSHRVAFAYVPWSYRFGLFLSAMTLMALAVLAAALGLR